MRKYHKLKQLKTETAPNQQRMTPWDVGEQNKNDIDNLVKVPTYRVQIVNKFLSKVLNKKDKPTPDNAHIPSKNFVPKSSVCFKQSTTEFNDSQRLRRRSKTEDCKKSKEEEQYDYQSYLVQFHKMKKETIQAKIVDLNMFFHSYKDFSVSEKRAQLQVERGNIARKLRMREELKAKKSLTASVSRKKQEDKFFNSLKLPNFLEDFAKVQTGKRPSVFRPSTSAVYRKKPSSLTKAQNKINQMW